MGSKTLEWTVLHIIKCLYENGSKQFGTDWQQNITNERHLLCTGLDDC